MFGVLAALQIFIRNRTGFLITRAVLGLAEAGYIPAAMYTLSTWYTKEQLTKRIAVFFFGMFGGAAIAPLLGAALLKLDGRGGLAGWKWIFLGEQHFPSSTPTSEDLKHSNAKKMQSKVSGLLSWPSSSS